MFIQDSVFSLPGSRFFPIPDPDFFSSRIRIYSHPGSIFFSFPDPGFIKAPYPGSGTLFLFFIFLFYRSPVFHFPPPGRGLLPPPIPSPSLDLQQTSPSGGQHKDELKVVVAFSFSGIMNDQRQSFFTKYVGHCFVKALCNVYI
jgi:hypothetical protein